MLFKLIQFLPHSREALFGPRILRYGFGILAVSTVTGCRLALDGLLGTNNPYLPFHLAVVLAAWLGGRGPGLAATALSALAIVWFYLEPFYTLVIPNPVRGWELAFFILTDTLISLLVGDLRAALQSRARAEEALLQSRDREFARAAELQAVMDALQVTVFIARDPECRNMIGNRKAYELFRVPSGANISKSAPEGEIPTSFRVMKYRQEVPPDDLPVQKAAATGQPVPDEEFEVVFQDGTRRDLLGAAVPLFDAKGRPRGAVGAFIDITDRKQAEAALRQSRDREFARAAELQAIIDAIPVSLYMGHDPECRYISGNPKAYELFRMPLGTNLSMLAPEGETTTAFRFMRDGMEIPVEELPMHKASATGEPVYDCELEVAFEDGSHEYIIGNAVPLFDADRHPRGAVGVFVNITERKQNEERLRHAQKLGSIGLLAGGVAHDFNNLLTVIVGNADSALSKCPSCEEIRDIIRASERAAHLTRQLLAYAGKGQFIATTFNLTDLVARSDELLSAVIPKHVGLVFHLSEQELLVKADSSQVEQILMNLVINAAEAIPPQTDGRIEISTWTDDVSEERVREHAPTFEARPGRFVCLEVTDNGTGMDDATQAQIFDPFFSTKFTGRGLGLAAVQGIVRSCKGFIDVGSARGVGSRFRVFLPAAGTQAPTKAPAGTAPEAPWRQNRDDPTHYSGGR